MSEGVFALLLAGLVVAVLVWVFWQSQNNGDILHFLRGLPASFRPVGNRTVEGQHKNVGSLSSAPVRFSPGQSSRTSPSAGADPGI
jgi:hypothetical protein